MSDLQRVVIAGGGTAGWITAATLSYALGHSVEITLVESPSIGSVGVGEATIPPLLGLHAALGISEKDILATVGGTYKLGIQFENWYKEGENYIHSFGSAGKDNWACRFIHYWLAGLKHGIDRPYGDYCMEHLAARKNKFNAQTGKQATYAYHLDAVKYAAMLRSFCEKRGVQRVEGTIKSAGVSTENGGIENLQLSDGSLVSGDFFVDCTGFRGILIDNSLKTPYLDWSHWLPCNSAIAVQTSSNEAPIPYTRAIAHAAGWRWRIPLQHRLGNGIVYCDKYMSDDIARQQLLNSVEGDPLNEPRQFRFLTGTRKKHWNKNCVAIGLSSGFLEPLEATSIHLIQQSATLLAKMLPNISQGAEIGELENRFNSRIHTEIEDIRDFLILHYCLTDREDSAFWRYCKSMDIPNTLQHKMNLFEQSALVFKESHELFAEESWAQVMMGQGVLPKSYHPAADALSADELSGFLGRVATQVNHAVSQMPLHGDFIDRFCKYKMKE